MTSRPRGSRRASRHPGSVPVAVALLAALLLSAVGWAAVRHGRATVLDQATEQVRSSADATARELQNQADVLVRSASTSATSASVLAGLRAPGPRTAAALQAELSGLARSTDSPAVFVTDLRGRVVAVHPAQPELVGADFSFRDWFRGVSRTGQPYVSEAYRSAANGQPLVVAVAVPVQLAARRGGYLCVLWPLESVRALAEGAERDDGVGITVTDQRGVPLTGSLAVDERGQARAPALSGPTRAALAGTTTSAVRGGQVLLARPVPGLGWTVTATQPTAVALAPARALRHDLVVAFALAFAVVLALTVPAVGRARRAAATQAAADDEHRRLAALFAASPVGIVETLPDGTVLAANEAMVDTLGYPVEQLLTMSVDDLAHPDENPAVPRGLDAAVAGRAGTWTGARLYRARDGSAVPAQVSVVALRDDAGQTSQLVGFVVDQRTQQAAADALRLLTSKVEEREAFLKTLFDTIDVSVMACDADGRLTLVNQRARYLRGMDQRLAPEELTDRLDLRHPDGRPMPVSETPLARALVEGEVRNAQVVVPARLGRPEVHLLAHAHRLTGSHGEVVGAVVAAHDITAVLQAEAALSASETRFRRVFDEALIGTLLLGEDGRVMRVNATFSRLCGRPASELVGTPFVACLADPDDQQRVSELIAAQEGELRAEMALQSAGGEAQWGSVALVWVSERDGRQLVLAQVEDITARRRAEQRITELALHDELTGLPNRRLLLERCERAFVAARSGRSGSSVAALFVDLDGFKPINDRAGHDTGDEVLASIAHDLQGVMRPTDTVARLGGDEFVVLLAQDEGLAYLRTVADRIGTTVRRQVMVEEMALPVSASIGIARVDLVLEPDVQPEQLLRRADAAMYRAKERGRDRHDVFDIELQEHTEGRRTLEASVREALAQGRLDVVFQPVVDVDSGLVVGAETLVRLRDADGRLLPTLPSIVAAEAAGLAELLGDQVLHLALGEARSWPAHLTVAVNVSARELTGRDLRTRVEQALQRHAFDPTRLVLEITESSILRAGPSALAELERLRSRGVKVAIDDFGTAYATLANLTSLPVDALKVDATFTAGLPHQRVHTAVVHGVASMAYELDIPCIIEGVETEVQLAAIRGMSVQAQGWLWGRPQGPGQLPTAVVVPPGPRLPQP